MVTVFILGNWVAMDSAHSLLASVLWLMYEPSSMLSVCAWLSSLCRLYVGSKLPFEGHLARSIAMSSATLLVL